MIEMIIDTYTSENLMLKNSKPTHPAQFPVTIRRADQTDVALIDEMHNRVSKESLYYRFLGPKKPNIDSLRCLCIDKTTSKVVLVATVQEPMEKVVALGYFMVNQENPTTAEPALLVEDRYQGCGIGKRIIKEMCSQAVKMGIETFDIFVDPSNYPMRHLIQRSGLRYESKFNNGLSDIRVWLHPNGRVYS